MHIYALLCISSLDVSDPKTKPTIDEESLDVDGVPSKAVVPSIIGSYAKSSGKIKQQRAHNKPKYNRHSKLIELIDGIWVRYCDNRVIYPL